MKRVVRLLRRIGLGRIVSLVLLAALLSLRVWDPWPLEAVRLRSFDLYQSIEPRPAGARPAVIVDIDEDSIRKYGQWPWPRTLVADLISRLTELGAAGIAFDIIFPELDRMSPAIAAASFPQLDEQTRQLLRQLPSNDDLLADALRRSRVVLGQSGIPRKGTETDDAPPPVTGFAVRGPDATPYLVTFPGLLRNVPILEEAAAGRGLFTIRPERDGIVRRLPMVMKAADAVVPSLTLELLRVVTRSGAILIRTSEAGILGVAVPGLELPTDRNGQLWVHFNHHDPTRYVSVQDILEGRVGSGTIGGKLMLIGTSAVGLLDRRTTPLDAVMPGVEIHAQVLESVLTNAALSYPNYAVAVELIVAGLIGLGIIMLAPMLGAATLVVLGAAVVTVLLGFSWYYFTRQRLLMDVSFPLLCSFAVFLNLTFVNYFREQAQRHRIRSAFAQYLSPAVVEQLARSPERLVLGGEDRVMTILFSDVRGFTSISELYKHNPHGLTTLMNRLLTPLTNAILENNGTIDKYIGDAIMAFWNAPLDDPRQEVNACAAALEMLERIGALNQARRQEAEAEGMQYIPLNVGIGINTGRSVVGNMGSDLRFNYSVLGDTVNLAARLEGQTKTYGVSILIGARTAQALGDRFAILEVDYVTVKGKSDPEIIYALVGDGEVARSPAFQELHRLNQDMLACYRRQDWSGALQALAAGRIAGKDYPVDHLYDIYAERIREFQASPPPPDWDGVFAHQTK